MLSGNKPSADEERKKPSPMEVDEGEGKDGDEVKEPSVEEMQKQSPLMEVAELRYLLTLSSDDEMGAPRAQVLDRLLGLVKQHSMPPDPFAATDCFAGRSRG